MTPGQLAMVAAQALGIGLGLPLVAAFVLALIARRWVVRP